MKSKKQSKSNMLKQIVLCIWIVLTIYVWLSLNIPEFIIRRAPSMISRSVLTTRKLVCPYVFRQDIFSERKNKEERSL